ncbi:unnamed protein product [Leptosia nina]|uniref:Centromere protein S n=1 Tax=Leptosia nina TaxID=320188 RepID=A0AAV1K5H0_9NEOP
MAIFSNLSSTQKVQAALYRDVRSICTEACHFLGLEITKPAMEIISELVFKKCAVYGTDLEAFAKHAKRSTINAEDVKLLVRRNPSLKARLNSISTNSTSKEKRRKTLPSVMKQVETPKTKEKSDNDVEHNIMAIDQTIDLTFE